MSVRALCRVSTFLLCAFSFSVQASGPPAAAFDAAIGDILKDEGLTGAVWAVVSPEHGVATGAAGISDAQSNAPLSPAHRVQIGSVTKTLLAAGILRLVTQGKVSLEAPVADLLPGVSFYNPWANTHLVRLRHLLDHTAGLDDARLWQIFSLRPAPDTSLSAALPLWLEARSPPGTRFSYSNTGYTLLGYVIEALTGQRYEAYLDANLLAPLGLRDSTFSFVTQARDERLAMGHFDGRVPQAAVPAYLRPAMQFTTTAADMAAFAQFLMSDGALNGEIFIDPVLLRAMGRANGTEAANAGLPIGYGLGLSMRDRHGVVGLCHSGNTVGYVAMLCLFPKSRRAFFVSYNSDSEDANYGRIERALIEQLTIPPQAPEPMRAHPMPIAGAMADDWSGFYVPSPNRFATLDLIDRAVNFVQVQRVGEGLRLNTLQSEPRELEPMGNNLFRLEGRIIPSHVLLVSGGRAVLSTGTQNYERVAKVELVVLWASLVGLAAGLVYVLIGGLIRMMKMRRPFLGNGMAVPFASVVLLAAPVPLFLNQSFLAMGDLTAASLTLAAVTALLAPAMLYGVWRSLHASRTPLHVVDALACFAVLQGIALFGVNGLWPLRLWS